MFLYSSGYWGMPAIKWRRRRHVCHLLLTLIGKWNHCVKRYLQQQLLGGKQQDLCIVSMPCLWISLRYLADLCWKQDARQDEYLLGFRRAVLMWEWWIVGPGSYLSS